MYKEWTPHLITPVLPPEGMVVLEDLAFDLTARASEFASKLHPVVRDSLGDLVRSMNCYYSNLIEGHNTHPIDIERALKGDYSQDQKKRQLQLEAKAHIHVQEKIDRGEVAESPYRREALCDMHQQFLSALPLELLTVRNPETGETRQVSPGELRKQYVRVGAHIPPPAEKVEEFLCFFEESYHDQSFSKMRQIIAIPAAHHRLLWIHPFLDGNGRVARLMDHAAFRQLAIGSSLWTPSRGLARRSGEYKELLMNADQQRQSDLDGRGNLSLQALVEFCEFYLTVCLDQVDYMQKILDPPQLLSRMERYSKEAIERGELRPGSFELLRYAFLHGDFERGKAAEITGYRDRQSRSVLSSLLKAELLVSDSPKGRVRLGFPIQAASEWFPQLFPLEEVQTPLRR
ncbi:Fic family protein [bacterium]|nr:Fic family protein [bacterium]